MKHESSQRPQEKVTKNAYGSLLGRLWNKMPLQTQWRVVCALTTAGAGLMTWYGMTAGPYFGSPLLTLIFWSIVIALIAATFFLVMLDVRFIRLRYALERQKLFKETLGSEDFRRALIRNQNKKNDSEPDTPPPSE